MNLSLAENSNLTQQGLSESEVHARRARGEGNDAPLVTGRSYSEILRENVFTFVNALLFGLGFALLLLGRVSDALVSVGVGSINLLVGVVQEVRAKRALDTITLLSRPTATVVREGRERSVDPTEVVLGDLLVAHSGDQIVVDGVVVNGRIDVDESLLTGESDPVPKATGDPVYSGSFAVSGHALYETRTVGAANLASRLTAGARAFRRVYTPLQWRINRVVRLVVVAVVILEALLLASAMLQGLPLVESVRNAMVVVGLVPNGLLLAIGLAYAMGAVRLAGRGALVQQANAVESLSHVDILFLDKTGTLTTNRMTLHGMYPFGSTELELRRVLGNYAASASEGSRTSDAIGAALQAQRQNVHEEVPFSSDHKWSALAFDGEPLDDAPTDDGVTLRGVYVLGAPEILLRHISRTADLPGMEALEEQAAAWSALGLRVLLLAHRSERAPLYDTSGEPRLPEGLVPLGLVSLSEELRPEAQETLASFAKAGVLLKIISGDNPRTVQALAAQAGFPAADRAMTGLELDQLDEGAFGTAAAETAIFGRVTPGQKERLVQALRERGHYVAMVGDGVNDVLALKRADLAIAMQSGSQATRAVADLILLHDSFAVLPDAFREGQRIVGGMRGILMLFLTRVLYVGLLILAVAAIQGTFPLGPKQSGLLSLFAVGIPTLALAAWARPAPAPRQGLLRAVLRVAVPAAFMLAVAGVTVYLGYSLLGQRALDPVQRQALAQTALTVVSIFAGLLLIVLVEPPAPGWTGGDPPHSDRRPALLALLLLLVFLAILAVPELRAFFDLEALTLVDYAVLALVAGMWALIVHWSWRTRLLDRIVGTRQMQQQGSPRVPVPSQPDRRSSSLATQACSPLVAQLAGTERLR
ncbi:MAG TPA: HAD-IC family P-type ATPase [Chloroflexota bacterium]|nr:HAD-IC family P-type ATPase [Chloroflexota bacterium]